MPVLPPDSDRGRMLRLRLREKRIAAVEREDPAAVPTPDDAAVTLAALCLPAETRHGEVVRYR